jgi:hypothetical protein
MEEFSTIDLVIAGLERDAELKRTIASNAPWSEAESTETARQKRLEAASRNFWKFDEIYFPPSVYSDGFSKPAPYHKELLAFWNMPGVDIFLGPRKHAKTATWKKFFCWLVLTGRLHFGGVMSEVLTKSENMLKDIARFLGDARIMYDFHPEFLENNSEQIVIKVKLRSGASEIAQILAFSEKRSAKGASFGLSRPRLILADDIETRRSPLGSDQVEHRMQMLQEVRSSLAENGTLVVLGNNFDERCALNKLKFASENDLLPHDWRVHVHKAFDGKPLWRERFPAKTEYECKARCGAADEGEWQGDFQQNPVPGDGFIFTRDQLEWFVDLPADSRGVLYCDPNLAKRGKGDSTAATVLLYSPSEDLFFIDNLLCHSFSSSRDLLSSVFSIYSFRCRALGWDGNVSQESTWTNLVREYSRSIGNAAPNVEYCRFNVDELAKNAQSAWAEGKFRFNAKLKGLPDTETYLRQLFAFAGKKANRADDAPDSLICAFELLQRRRLGRRSKNLTKPIVINDTYF